MHLSDAPNATENGPALTFSGKRWNKMTTQVTMIKAILIDLDNTLIRNPDLGFAIEFLRRSDEYFGARWGYNGFSRVFRRALREMSSDTRSPDMTNSVFIVSLIAQYSGISAREVSAGLRDFYADVHPLLRSCVRPVQGAAELLSLLRETGYAVVIATNPIYPLEAILQRLSWGNLPNREDDYAFVTHAANMHFAKPDRAYYAEILARIGVEPDEALMIGDSIKNDIEPATMMRLHTYHITDTECSKEYTRLSPLVELLDTIKSSPWLDEMLPSPLSPKMIVPELRGNVGGLFGLLDGIKPHFWLQHPDPNEWSILQIVAHLYESEITVQRPRLENILASHNPFLADPQAPPGPDQFRCKDDGMSYVYRFAAAREETIALLRTLQPEDWERPARHSIFGPTNLLEMAHFTAQHDRLHLNQLCQTMGNCE
jgi:FMN phosphatase YigB (HAD superfamily)